MYLKSKAATVQRLQLWVHNVAAEALWLWALWGPEATNTRVLATLSLFDLCCHRRAGHSWWFPGNVHELHPSNAVVVVSFIFAVVTVMKYEHESDGFECLCLITLLAFFSFGCFFPFQCFVQSCRCLIRKQSLRRCEAFSVCGHVGFVTTSGKQLRTIGRLLRGGSLTHSLSTVTYLTVETYYSEGYRGSAFFQYSWRHRHTSYFFNFAVE